MSNRFEPESEEASLSSAQDQKSSCLLYEGRALVFAM